MSKKLLGGAVAIALLATAGLLLAQQEYPNIPDIPIVFENDQVVAQRMDFGPGEWAGAHSHAGNQIVVILDAITMLYKEGGEEVERSFETGTVFWVDATDHDHKTIKGGSAILISFKE